jgi:hypothetical protein
VQSWHGSAAMRVGLLIQNNRPPPPPPPYTEWAGGLTSDKCSAMLRDPTHVFRRMWAAESWGKMGQDRPACWERKRDAGWMSQSPLKFFQDLEESAACNTNWYTGNGARPQHSIHSNRWLLTRWQAA